MSNTAEDVLSGANETRIHSGVRIGIFSHSPSYNLDPLRRQAIFHQANDLADSIEKINRAMGGHELPPHHSPFLFFNVNMDDFDPDSERATGIIPIPSGLDREDLEFFWDMFELAAQHELGARFINPEERFIYRDLSTYLSLPINSIFSGDNRRAPLYQLHGKTKSGLWLMFGIKHV